PGTGRGRVARWAESVSVGFAAPLIHAYLFGCLTRWRAWLRAAAVAEEPVLRPRQAEILPQRPAFVVAPEQAAPLQFRHHAVDEVVEPAGQVGELHREAVGAFGGEPFLHLVGDGLGRPDHGEAGKAAETLGELSDGEVFPPRQVDRPLPPALRRIAL